MGSGSCTLDGLFSTGSLFMLEEDGGALEGEYCMPGILVVGFLDVILCSDAPCFACISV